MRLLIVSNRLPITAVDEEGQLKFKDSVGGLVSGLSAYLDSLKGSGFTQFNYVWIGWPGASAEGEKREALKTRAREFNAYPVFLTEEAMDKFYLGFCNKTIWPLFHYFPTYAVYDWDYWNQYEQVNRTFCDTVLEILKPGDVVWVHDYHLMLLPRMLRARAPDVPIGFFLHIPFPSFEIFRLMPETWRKEILLGLLGADLLGFHTHDYTEYFLRCVLRLLGHEHTMGKMIVDGHIKKAETFPMGIDFERFQKIAHSPEARESKNKLRKTFPDAKIILSVDRLDYSKGVINRLHGYARFLEKNPEWREKVMLSMIVVPSRIGVEHYQETKSQIDGLVGEINGEFGTLTWTPILYQYKFLPITTLVPLYAATDVVLVTPLRDGMNLVAKEYIATRTDQTGVLILSEMAGAVKELGEAIIINPNHAEDIARALKEALEMPRDEQIRRNTIMQTRLKRYDVVSWASEFVQTLIAIHGEQEKFDAKYLGYFAVQKLTEDFHQAQRRLFLLDYDGTLAPFTEQPQTAKPSKDLIRILAAFAADQSNVVVLISGRDKETLSAWFGALGVNLIAEHGAWLSEKDGAWRLFRPLKNDWKTQVLPILDLYADRVPGSFVEEKEFSIAWHYRKADLGLGAARAKELVDDLVHFIANTDVQVLSGNKIVEVRSASVSKGTSIMHWLADPSFDFILAAGNDGSDEDIFKILPPTAYSIKVGMTPSHAKFNLFSPTELIRLLSELTAAVHHPCHFDKSRGA
ncbi:MAG: bifunctional alpha,alpha-trehalose-phosphate synthase (UDP-forming)/trehalose-phosphatase [Chloroflexi bacterium]|nr:bifunctional alpha,alpha-trehalose-phosphate synthase (UDP-forming)/trehalose-phosphatase [Chloroflexota bacterium]